jgi:DedD protein
MDPNAMNDDGIRDLEQLQEDDSPSMPRGVTVAFVVLGGAAVVFGAFALGGRGNAARAVKVDPLGDLVSSRAESAKAPPKRTAADLLPADVAFPRLLSDDNQPTTAMALVAPTVRSPASASLATAPVPATPPPAADRLPVVPLPAQAVLEASPVVTRPRDPLTKAASDAAQITGVATTADTAQPGHDGGYQLQVSSFRTQSEADAFAEQLRARGHKAYVLEAHVSGRGTWYRVRIGPFATQHAATQYRASFESREHVVPFVVPPETTARVH